MPKDRKSFPGLTSLWIENKNDKHFFINLNNTKTWREYLDDKQPATYRLHMYDGPNLFLQNTKKDNSYVILTKKGYALGPLHTLSKITNTQLTPGFWHTAPNFPKSI